MINARSAPSTAQARVVVDELLRHGVRDVVLCPGSRNAPLAFALAEAAAAGRVRLHVRIDERSAAYLALGLARGSRMVVPIVVTSGTAVANLHPAIVEAHESGTPLLAITANRPPELWGSGANQTIAQVGIFGEHAPCVQLGVASEPGGPEAHQRWRAQVGRAVFLTADAAPQPVQLDIPFQVPLVPTSGDESWTGETAGGRTGTAPWISTAEPGGIRELLADARTAASVSNPRGADFGAGTRTLVVAGSDAPDPGALAALPTIAEPGAVRPLHPVHPLAAERLEPDRIVVLGRPTLQRSVLALLARADIQIFAVPGTSRRWFNPGSAPQVRLGGIPAPPAGGRWSVDPAWLHTVDDASGAAAEAVAAEIDRTEAGESAPTGLDVASVVSRAVRASDVLVVGSSNPIRDIALVHGLPAGARVFSNRGAAGIDGNIAAAIGVALAVEGEDEDDRERETALSAGRTIALVGDLTFLHDAGALLIGPGEPRPRDLTIVVANDSGGGIFSLLEQGDARLSAHFERVFGTPHEASIGELCAGYGVPHELVDLAGLEEALGDAAAAGEGTGGATGDATRAEPAGIRVLEVRTSRADLRERHGRIGGW
ncbi:2-succinyl-5-enolpyruvyl-6-hydroxy-3-cyclohexene-1-carboxylic-acid synthase [Dietzia sp.]|uniref:2-succinyl-5-enolpyruvyl-6-hydroxy-3- cyclohexene-1-carboxylic-acid synthase n=1 Tax=Dietzia sp. TaxID=1871616 RepID=UPI002FD96309